MSADPVETHDEVPSYIKLMSTPRTKEACRRVGIELDELRVKSLHDFYIPGELAEVQQLRFNHYETRRQEKFNLVQSERAKVISEAAMGLGDDDKIARRGQMNLQIVEGLMAKVGKRLEKNLRAQARYHATVQRENHDQLEKEKVLAQKRAIRKQRAANVQRIKQSRSQQMKAVIEARTRLHEDMKDRIETEVRAKQAELMTVQIEESLRVDEFKRAREKAFKSLKSEEWRIKAEEMLKRIEEQEIEKVGKGVKLLETFENKIHSHERQKFQEIRMRKLRGEEVTLRIVDAKEKRRRLEREDLQKRLQIASQLEEEDERIATLMSTKEQVMQKQHEIVAHQESIHGRPINIKRITPGPADYSQFANTIHEAPVPKFAQSKPKLMIPGSTDFELKKSAEIPPPGSYDPILLPSGDRPWHEVPVAKWGTTKKKTYLDYEQASRKHIPGPGTYTVDKSSLVTNAPKIVRDYVDTHEKPKPWMKPNDNTPGPATYTVDSFTRLERLKKSQKSLPDLRKALVMTMSTTNV